MAAGRARKRFTIGVKLELEPMSAVELAGIERSLGRLIARAYIADHAELFGLDGDPQSKELDSGPLPTARAEVASPATSGGGPEQTETGDEPSARRPTK